MPRYMENPAAGDGGAQCALGKTHSDNITLLFKILMLSCPKFQIQQIITLPERITALRFSAMLSRIHGDASTDASSGEDFPVLRVVPWWRHLPWGCTLYPDESCVIFDRDNLELACLRLDKSPAVLPPRELISPGDLRWFYCDATAPNLDPDTLPRILLVANLCGSYPDIYYRQALSDQGRISCKIWPQHW